MDVMYMYGKTNDCNLREIGWFIQEKEIHKGSKSIASCSTSGPYASSYSAWNWLTELADVLLRNIVPNSVKWACYIDKISSLLEGPAYNAPNVLKRGEIQQSLPVCQGSVEEARRQAVETIAVCERSLSFWNVSPRLRDMKSNSTVRKISSTYRSAVRGPRMTTKTFCYEMKRQPRSSLLVIGLYGGLDHPTAVRGISKHAFADHRDSIRKRDSSLKAIRLVSDIPATPLQTGLSVSRGQWQPGQGAPRVVAPFLWAAY